jgi:hypothetical protein
VPAGGDDPDAVLVALHLLSGGLYASAARLEKVVLDALPHLVVELGAQIRAWRVDRPCRSYATALLRLTERRVLRERFPQCVGGNGWMAEVPVPPAQITRAPAEAVLITGADDRRDVDVIDLLLWATRIGVISRGDVELLLELETTYRRRSAAWRQAAARYRVCTRTLWRRRERAEAALRAAVRDYPGRVA